MSPLDACLSTGKPHRRRRILLSAAGAVLALAVLAGVAADTWSSGGADPAVMARLLGLADRITDVPADHHSGPYTYLHSQSWARMPGPDRHDLIGRVDVEHWQHITGTVHMATRRLPSWPDLDHTVDGSDRPQFAGAPVQTSDFTAKQVQPPIAPEAIATDPASLTAQLLRLRHSTGTDELLFAITEINYYGYVGRTQRATILRVLAGLAGIGYDGETADIAGRTGVTFRYTDVAQAATTWLTINPTTGEILAYRRVFAATGRTIFSRYWLLLDRDRREYL